jgi:transcriptional regulator with XRE-family HTH domain
MEETIQEIVKKRRIEFGLTLRDLAKALGPGFSPARLSLSERGLVDMPAHDQRAVLEAIERLAPLCKHRRRIVELARDMDLAPFVADVRAARCVAARA